MATKAEKWQNLIYKMYGKVSKNLGRTFDVYRPQQLDNPLNGSNWIYNTIVAFSQDWGYGGPHGEGLSKWKTWVDGRFDNNFTIQPGDHFYSSETDETYFVAAVQPHLDIQSIRAPDRISVYSFSYSDGANGYGASDTEVASSVPAWIQQQSSAGGGGLVPASTYATDTLPLWVIYIWDGQKELNFSGEVQRRYSVVDQDGNRSQVLTIIRDDIGTKLITRAYNP